ncbi:phytosulfokine receptor 1-like [Papaver somniferum]|uniref:phytosulfokine receptor 1-like n=1 Tax=Papaver somniferum TaxID=3469 RepID=UPI000E6F6473|nr:phytosulfokine receptor 1-like [Papaver somniferum]
MAALKRKKGLSCTSNRLCTTLQIACFHDKKANNMRTAVIGMEFNAPMNLFMSPPSTFETRSSKFTFNNLEARINIDTVYKPIFSTSPRFVLRYILLFHFHLLLTITFHTMGEDSGEFGGLLPSLPQLQELDVSVNWNLHLDLTEMLKHQSPKLQSLSISYTQFLDLSTNNIRGHIHSSISNLKDLKFLDLSNNNIQGHIPKSVCKLLPLRQLSLGNNNISGSFPSCVMKLRDLSVLSVFINSIEGKVPLISLINKLNLTILDLSSNTPTVVIDKHLNLTKLRLESLELQSCKLKGSIPTFICQLIHLRRLDVSHNNLTRDIYSCISRLKNLQYLDLSNNKFRGPLPLFHLKVLIDNFDVSNNKFSGEISMETGKRLCNASMINLSGNELSGSVPFSICSRTTETMYLDLSNNKLSGLIPTSIGYCSILTYLNLGTNNLIGSVPNELEQTRVTLPYLLLNANSLNGTLLNSFSNFQELMVLNLENNNLEGSIPATFGSLNKLHFLSLRSNKFNGSIPNEIFHLQKLRILDLSINNFSGYIPKKLGNLSGLLRKSNDLRAMYDIQFQMVIKGILIQFERFYYYASGIDISCNNLEGNIPKEIGSLKGLPMLNLSYNHLSGDIPENVGNMFTLESLDLSFNRLSGHIPQSLTSIDSLGFLNLSYNKLSGRILRGTHFETLSVDGSAFLGNKLLCGIPTKKVCEGDEIINPADTSPPNKLEEDDHENGKEKLFFFGVVALGFIVGFWGLFSILLIKRETWWFGYWRFVDSVAERCLHCNNHIYIYINDNVLK